MDEPDMEGIYAPQAEVLLTEHQVDVLDWTDGTGMAYRRLAYRERPTHKAGAYITEAWIDTPQPDCPEHFAVLAHEVGHHALGHTISQFRMPNWQREHEAWMFSILQMRRFKIPMTEDVEDRYKGNMREHFYRALAAGLKEIPKQILLYLDYPEWVQVKGAAPHEQRNLIYQLLRAHA